MKKITKIAMLLLFTLTAFSQKNVYLNIQHNLGNNVLNYNQTATNDIGQTFTITRADYYISQFKLIHDGGQETAVDMSKYVLAKGSTSVNMLLGSFSITNLEGIKFSIGVNTPTNNEDPTLWPSGHPLAPQSPSMHWGWTSGYRFLCLEGKSGSGLTTTFELHGLGNANYFTQTVMTQGVDNGSSININLIADIVNALKGINVNAGPTHHGVNRDDLYALQNFRDFVFRVNTALNTKENNFESSIQLYPNPNKGIFYLDTTLNSSNISKIEILDVSGKILKVIKLGESKIVSVELLNKGLYFVKPYSENQSFAIQKIIIE